MFPIRTAAALAIAASLAIRGAAQVPDSRLIDTEPRIQIGMEPPGATESGEVPRRRSPVEDRRTEPERRIDLDLDLKERRESRGGSTSSTKTVAAAAAFVAAGAALLVLITWLHRRGNR